MQFQGTVIFNNGSAVDSTLASAQRVVDEGVADLVCLGRPFLVNPDLVERLSTAAGLNEPRPASFYAGRPAEYTDYPALAA